MTINPLVAVARTGYATRAVVYFLVGGLAVLAAFGGRSAPGTKDALMQLMDTGFGSILLAIVAAGLFCYGLWRLVQALADSDGHGRDVKGLTVRAGLLTSAVTHGALGVWALSAAFAGAGGGGRSGFASWLMQQPYGPWLVMAAGAAIAGAGAAHILKGTRMGYEKWFQASQDKMNMIRPVATIGLSARGIVFIIAGGLFVFAGLEVEPERAGGLAAALQWVQQQPYGAILFTIIAIGMVCFAAYSLLEACYRRINAVEPESYTPFGDSTSA